MDRITLRLPPDLARRFDAAAVARGGRSRYLRTLMEAAAQAPACKNRGDLDTLYCDENNDLVADVPTDKKRLKNPSTIVFAYTPVEDPAIYENIFRPFTDYLAKCTAKKIVYYPVQSNSAEIEAMSVRPAFMIHTGDISHLSKPVQFDTARQLMSQTGLTTYTVPGEHDILEEDGKSVTARGTHPDTMVASAQAYISALNKLMHKRQSVNPQTAYG